MESVSISTRNGHHSCVRDAQAGQEWYGTDSLLVGIIKVGLHAPTVIVKSGVEYTSISATNFRPRMYGSISAHEPRPVFGKN